MKSPIHYGLLCLCLLLFANSCRNKKTAVSKGKVKKQVAVKQAPKPDTPASPVSGNSSCSTMLHQQLHLSDKEIAASKLFSFITDWYGVPYKYGGCQKNGIDCSCFTSLLYEKVYNRKMARSAGDMYKDCEKVTLEEAREGDLIFFKISGTGISHVGIYLRNKWFVHSSTSKGVIISSMEEAYYKKYFHAGGRLKSL
jgi:murein DD-endopeptidase / murein LD-carboxypeptidase